MPPPVTVSQSNVWYFSKVFEHRPTLTFEDLYFSYEFQGWDFGDEDASRELIAYELHLRLLEKRRAEAPPTETRPQSPYHRTPELARTCHG